MPRPRSPRPFWATATSAAASSTRSTTRGGSETSSFVRRPTVPARHGRDPFRTLVGLSGHDSDVADGTRSTISKWAPPLPPFAGLAVLGNARRSILGPESLFLTPPPLSSACGDCPTCYVHASPSNTSRIITRAPTAGSNQREGAGDGVRLRSCGGRGTPSKRPGVSGSRALTRVR